MTPGAATVARSAAEDTDEKSSHTPRGMWLRRAHLIVGLTMIVVFLGTGQYMDRVHDHLRGMSDAQRLLFRSVHIYLLLSAFVNVTLGLYMRARVGRVPQLLQGAGSLLLLAGPVLLLVAFTVEPYLTGLDRPYTRPAVYGMLVGVLLHLAAAGAAFVAARPR